MRRTSLARLSFLPFFLVLAAVATPSHAADPEQTFPACPAESCSYYANQCAEEGGTFRLRNVSYGLCEDENFYIRSYQVAYCSGVEMGTCASY